MPVSALTCLLGFVADIGSGYPVCYYVSCFDFKLLSRQASSILLGLGQENPPECGRCRRRFYSETYFGEL